MYNIFYNTDFVFFRLHLLAHQNTTSIASQSFNPKCLVLQENSTLHSFGSGDIDMRSGEVRYRHYYIAAEEITWDYGIRKPHQLIRPRLGRIVTINTQMS